jgi:predicted transcriptional regulator
MLDDSTTQSDYRASLVAKILEVCKQGAAKSEIMHKLSLSHSQLRRLSAELVDKGLLQFSEPGIYVTTDKGYEFLWLKSKDGIRTNKRKNASNFE